MTLYHITPEKLERVERTTFSNESILERQDLQRLLRQDISPIGDDLMVLAEEFGEWEDSHRRVDLLCLSRSRQLVVVEIKRTEGGGHMELQAVRYAAMVSNMTLDQAIAAYSRNSGQDGESAASEILGFLDGDSEDEAELSGEVRIVLVSADFSTEITTAVLWLNRQGLDITCIRLRPYRLEEQILIDATQIIPLPETADYEVKRRTQEKEQKKALTARKEILRRYWTLMMQRAVGKTDLWSNKSTTHGHWISVGIGRGGFSLTTSMTSSEVQVEISIRVSGSQEESKKAFHALKQRQAEIEEQFGEQLDWQELPEKTMCRVCTRFDGGWSTPEENWPELQDKQIDTAMRLEVAFRRPLQELSY